MPIFKIKLFIVSVVTNGMTFIQVFPRLTSFAETQMNNQTIIDNLVGAEAPWLLDDTHHLELPCGIQNTYIGD